MRLRSDQASIQLYLVEHIKSIAQMARRARLNIIDVRRRVGFQSHRKVTLMVTWVETGRSFFSPGRNFHFWTASIAFSSRPISSPLTTLMS